MYLRVFVFNNVPNYLLITPGFNEGPYPTVEDPLQVATEDTPMEASRVLEDKLNNPLFQSLKCKFDALPRMEHSRVLEDKPYYLLFQSLKHKFDALPKVEQLVFMDVAFTIPNFFFGQSR